MRIQVVNMSSYENPSTTNGIKLELSSQKSIVIISLKNSFL